MKMMMMMVAVVMAVIMAAKGGKVYIVGDDAGWTSADNVDYKAWSATKTFHVGDTIVFNYFKIFHDVARVSYTDFQTCNISKPYKIYNSGNDSFPIKHPGHYFFICTKPYHCESGQKVDIRVPESAPADSPTPVQPLPFPYPQPYAPSPSPSPVTIQAPEVSQSQSPSWPRGLPAPIPVVPAPEVAPVQQKNAGNEGGIGFKMWMMVMMVWVSL